MRKIRVSLKKGNYEIIICNRARDGLGRLIRGLNIGQDAFIVTNRKVWKILGSRIAESLKAHAFSMHTEFIPDSEKAKSFSVWSDLIKKIVSYDKGKNIFLIALGGGVVGDIAGFTASVYKRGIPYVQTPTTLLAQVDSAIGGKTAIDLPCGKNLIGSFYQPRLVFSDISVLESLPRREIKNGLAEIVKYGVIKNRRLFEYIESECADFTCSDWEYIVGECSSVKARIIEKDEYDREGIRMLLNFGHTIGHGIEAASEYTHRYHHGEAVALGMLLEAELGTALGYTTKDTLKRIENLLLRIGLPNKISGLRVDNIIKAIGYDKKFQGARTRMVIPETIGRGIIKEGIPLELIRKTIRKRLS